jgi:membrane fusion protein (multidrug efflux system)
VDAYKGDRFRGYVESVSPATGAKFSLLPPDNATGNFTKVVQRVPVRIRLAGGGVANANRPLRPGMSVVATIKTK